MTGPSVADRIDAAIVMLAREFDDPQASRTLKRWSGVDVERSGFVLMARIEERPGSHLAHLAESAGIDVSTASRQMTRLLQEGLVRRSPDPAEHRARRHDLTADGERALRRLRGARRERIERLVADFSSAEQLQLAGLLERFVAAFGEGSWTE
jgi:DNA-binding MarR family transcriptional regulator